MIAVIFCSTERCSSVTKGNTTTYVCVPCNDLLGIPIQQYELIYNGSNSQEPLTKTEGSVTIDKDPLVLQIKLAIDQGIANFKAK